MFRYFGSVKSISTDLMRGFEPLTQTFVSRGRKWNLAEKKLRLGVESDSHNESIDREDSEYQR